MSDQALVIDDDEVTETPEAPEEETQPEASQEETPEEAPEPPKVEFTEEQQAIFNDQIGKKVAKQREAERVAEEERQKREELEARLAKLEDSGRPEIPPIPDPFDDDFEAKVKARDEALLKSALYDAEQQRVAQQKQYQAQQAQQAKLQEMQDKVTAYSGRADKLGIKPEELQAAGNQVAQMGVGEEIAGHILDDEQGPAITMYLAKNPMEVEQIRSMGPLRAAVYIETNIKGKAVAARPKVSTAPAPTESPKGSGMPEGEKLPGVTYE